jgi:agmatine deiminase
MKVIRELAPYVKVNLGVQDGREIALVKRTLKENGISDRHIVYYVVPHNEIWVRDIGPAFVKNSTGGLAVVDFNFDVWGYEEDSPTEQIIDGQVDRIIAGQLGLPVIRSDMISEGGDREFNGKGTIMVTEAVELQRNPHMAREEMEAEFKRLFGVKRIIWLKKGLYEDDSTFMGTLPGPNGPVYTSGTPGGHTDVYARFAGPDTILLVEVTEDEVARDPIARVNRERLEENYRILRSATDQDGKPFNIVRVPVPDHVFDTLAPGDAIYDYIKSLEYLDGSRFPEGKEITVILSASYLNFLITNGAIIGSSYWVPGRPESMRTKDEQARKILEGAFPGRKVILINAENINLGGGDIRCKIQQQPAP